MNKSLLVVLALLPAFVIGGEQVILKNEFGGAAIQKVMSVDGWPKEDCAGTATFANVSDARRAECSKLQFVSDVKAGDIEDKILACIRQKGLNAGQDKEYQSWHNSMQFMRNIVDDDCIEDEVRIAIEYNIPLTSKRVDFIIYGSDDKQNDNQR